MSRMMPGGKGLAWVASTEIHPGISGQADPIVTKHVQDGFENPELGRSWIAVKSADFR